MTRAEKLYAEIERLNEATDWARVMLARDLSHETRLRIAETMIAAANENLRELVETGKCDFSEGFHFDLLMKTVFGCDWHLNSKGLRE